MYLKHDRRLTESLVLYWQGLRHERLRPVHDEVKIEDIPELWPDCYILAVEAGSQQLRFEQVGAHIQQLAMSAEFEHQELGRRMTHLALNGLSQHKVMLDEQEFPFGNEQLLKYRAIVLPLGDETKITHLLGGVRYKRFPQTEDVRQVEPDPYEGLMEELSHKPKAQIPRAPSQAYITQGGINPMLQTPSSSPQAKKEEAPTENPLFMSPAEYQAQLSKQKDPK